MGQPVHFVPVLPTLLLNGADGIGTGWSTTCYGYNPMTVLDNVLANAEGRSMVPMVPWAAGFKGEIEPRTGSGRGQPMEAADLAAGARPTRFLSRGVAELTPEGVVVSELPLGAWTIGYKAWLQQEMREERACWESFAERHTDRSVCFAFTHSREQLKALGRSDAPPLYETYQLESKHGLANMHAFNAANELCHFGRPEEIIEMHASSRIELYTQRKAHSLAVLDAELSGLEARARFIEMALRGELPLFERAPRSRVVDALRAASFAPHPAQPPSAGGRLVDAMSPADGSNSGGGEDGGEAAVADGPRAFLLTNRAPYAHLLSMPIVSLTAERVTALEKQIAAKQQEAAELRGTTELQMWTRELEALRPAMAAYLEERCSVHGADHLDGAGGTSTRTTGAVKRRQRSSKPKAAAPARRRKKK